MISVARRKRTKKVVQNTRMEKRIYVSNRNHEQGQCRCCHAEGNFRLMTMNHQYTKGHFRSYTEMLRVAFNISLAQIRINGKEKSTLICPTCEVRLRDAHNFYLHVRESEEKFFKALPPEAELIVEMESIDDSEKRDLSIDTELVVLDDESVEVNAESGGVNSLSDGVHAKYVGVKAEAVDVTADAVNVTEQCVVKAGPNDVNISSVYLNAEPMKTKEVESEKETTNTLFEIKKIKHGIDHYELFTDYDKLNKPIMAMDISKELDIPKDLEIKTEPEDQNDFADITVTDTFVAIKNEITTNKLMTVNLNDDQSCDRYSDSKINDPLNTSRNLNNISDNVVAIKIEDGENDEMPVIATDTVKIKKEKDKDVSNRPQVKPYEVSIERDDGISVTEPSFVQEVAMTSNQKMDHKKPFNCPYCYNRFQLRRELNVHTKGCNNVTKKKGNSLKCSFCAVVVDGNFQDISEHMLLAHGLTAIMRKAEPTVKPTTAQEQSSKSTYSCNKCSLGFEDLEEFQTHKKTHPVTCVKCFSIFSSSVSLIQHMASAHPYKCNLCNDCFDHSGLLQRHKVRTHGAEYSCGRCDKVFYQRQELWRHERVEHFHLYKCAHCDHKAPRRSELYEHILAEHKIVEQNEFPCRLCEKKYKYKATLKQHFSFAHPVEPFE